MFSWHRIRPVLTRLLGALMLMACGAWLALSWIEWKYPVIAKDVKVWRDLLFWSFLGAGIVRDGLAPSSSPGRKQGVRLPDLSGTVVVALCGGAIAFAFWQGDMLGSPDRWAAVIVLMLTVVLMIASSWFAYRHKGEVGEARFDTTNRTS